MNPLRGFVYEPPEYDVGLMSGGWVHEECPAWAADVINHPDEIGEVIETALCTVRVNDWTIRTWWLLTCTDCVQQVIVDEDDLSPTDEVMAQEARAEAEAEAYAEAYYAAFDDDPNPYSGTYSEM